MRSGIIPVSVEESRHAYRVNGVTVAKRHLVACFPSRAEDSEKLLWSYLVTVPFLHQAFDVPVKASKHVKYCAAKAHRVFHALNLEEDAILPFMIVAMKGSGDINGDTFSPDDLTNTQGAFHKLTEVFAGMKAQLPQKDKPDNVVQFRPNGKTVH